jgi:hypothetical protein
MSQNTKKRPASPEYVASSDEEAEAKRVRARSPPPYGAGAGAGAAAESEAEDESYHYLSDEEREAQRSYEEAHRDSECAIVVVDVEEYGGGGGGGGGGGAASAALVQAAAASGGIRAFVLEDVAQKAGENDVDYYERVVRSVRYLEDFFIPDEERKYVERSARVRAERTAELSALTVRTPEEQADMVEAEMEMMSRNHQARLAKFRKMLEDFEEALRSARNKKDVRRKYEGNPQTFEKKTSSELFRFGRVVSVNRFVHDYKSKRPSVSTDYAVSKYKSALHKFFRK